MGGVSEAGEEAMRQACNRGVGWRARIAERHRYSDSSDDCGDDRQYPNGAVGAEVLFVEHAKMFRNFLILAHGVCDASSCIHAREGRPDQSKEYRDGLSQHEVA